MIVTQHVIVRSTETGPEDQWLEVTRPDKGGVSISAKQAESNDIYIGWVG